MENAEVKENGNQDDSWYESAKAFDPSMDIYSDKSKKNRKTTIGNYHSAYVLSQRSNISDNETVLKRKKGTERQLMKLETLFSATSLNKKASYYHEETENIQEITSDNLVGYFKAIEDNKENISYEDSTRQALAEKKNDAINLISPSHFHKLLREPETLCIKDFQTLLQNYDELWALMC